MNSKKNSSAADSSWQDIEAQLEPALDRLRPADRESILLRFYEQKDHAEIAAILGISSEASQKRLSRAIERLRAMLGLSAKTNWNLSAAIVGEMLVKNAVGPSPASLAKSLASLSTSTLPRNLAGPIRTVAWKMTFLNLKAIAAGVIMLCVIAQGAALIIHRDLASLALVQTTQTVAAIAPATTSVDSDDDMTLPWKFHNSEFVKNPVDQPGWTASLDGGMKRTADAEPAAHLHESATASPGTAPYLKHDVVSAKRVQGKHIAISAWVKARDLTSFGVIQVFTSNPKKTFSIDQTSDSLIRGTSDWRPYTLVTDIPPDATDISISLYIAGPGDIWLDGVQIDSLWSAFPATGDQLQWHFWGPAAANYSSALDPVMPHDGHPSMCVSSSMARPADWIGLDHPEPSFEKFLGHKIQIRAWMKLENVEENAGIAVSVGGMGNKTIARVDVPTRDTPHGTADWKEYRVTISIPLNAQNIRWGFKLVGRGKIWIDLDHAQCELADEERGL